MNQSEIDEAIKPYWDSFGMLVQSDMDGGDSIQKICIYGMYSEGRVELVLNLLKRLEVKPGVFVRHMDKTMWYSDPDAMSRDNSRPVVVFLGHVINSSKTSIQQQIEATAMLARIYQAHEDRNFWYRNVIHIGGKKKWINLPGFAGPAVRGEYIRSFLKSRDYWKLYFTDISLVFTSLRRFRAGLIDIVKVWLSTFVDPVKNEKRFKKLIAGRVSNDINHFNACNQAKHYMPTLVSRLAIWIYVRRPVPEIYGAPGIYGSWKWFYRKSMGGPPLFLVAQRHIEDL